MNFEATKELELTSHELNRLQDAHLGAQKSLQNKEEEVNKLKREIDNIHNEMYTLQRKNKEMMISKEAVSPFTGFRPKGIASDSELLRESLIREEKLENKIVTLKSKLKEANRKIMELLPYKAMYQKGPSVTYQDVMFNRPLTTTNAYVSNHPGNLLSRLKARYGIVDNYAPSVSVEPIVPDSKLLTSKYGFGIERKGSPSKAHSSRSEMRKIRNKYGFEDSIDRMVSRDEEIIQYEIKRTADEGLRKYGLNPPSN